MKQTLKIFFVIVSVFLFRVNNVHGLRVVQSQTKTLGRLLAGVVVLIIIASTMFISGRKEEQE